MRRKYGIPKSTRGMGSSLQILPPRFCSCSSRNRVNASSIWAAEMVCRQRP
jgi:hypothetical protein